MRRSQRPDSQEASGGAAAYFYVGNSATVYQSAELLTHGCQCSLFHTFLDGILNPVVRDFQHFADILCHRAGTALAEMNLNQRGAPFRFQYAIDQIQCDLGWIGTQLGTVISPAFLNALKMLRITTRSLPVLLCSLLPA